MDPLQAKLDSIWMAFKESVLADAPVHGFEEYRFVVNRVLDERRGEFERFCRDHLGKKPPHEVVQAMTKAFTAWILEAVVAVAVKDAGPLSVPLKG